MRETLVSVLTLGQRPEISSYMNKGTWGHDSFVRDPHVSTPCTPCRHVPNLCTSDDDWLALAVSPPLTNVTHDQILVRRLLTVTVVILAQGTHWAVALAQAFLAQGSILVAFDINRASKRQEGQQIQHLPSLLDCKFESMRGTLVSVFTLGRRPELSSYMNKGTWGHSLQRDSFVRDPHVSTPCTPCRHVPNLCTSDDDWLALAVSPPLTNVTHDQILVRRLLTVTVVILAQGTHWAVALAQAFLAQGSILVAFDINRASKRQEGQQIQHLLSLRYFVLKGSRPIPLSHNLSTKGWSCQATPTGISRKGWARESSNVCRDDVSRETGRIWILIWDWPFTVVVS